MSELLPTELIVDLFAGGGGASEGIFLATGRHPDIAINHDGNAIACHAVNHPETQHLCASIWKVDPVCATDGRPVGLLWASPDCRHFSRAAGGRPKWKSVRSLPGVVLTWAKRARPRVIMVENVREFLGWGPLLDDGTPCPRRIGLSFNIWAGRLRGLGYKVEWRELCAADYGAPTIRTRLFVIARRDGAPIGWPQPTHGRRPGMFELPWRTAAECIDWSLPCRSIFERSRPLKPATMRRIAEGVTRYVIQAAKPFIIRTGHYSYRSGEGFGFRGQGCDAPLGTVCASVNEKALVVPHVSKFYGTSVGSAATAPLGTVTAHGEHHAMIAAHLAPITHQGERRGSALTDPVPTLTTANRGEHALVAAYLAQHNGGMVGNAVSGPVTTITARASQQQLIEARLSAEDQAGAARVAAFLISYYSTGGQHQSIAAPLGAVTTRDRFALVVVDGIAVPIVDIGMRMLTPAELQAAQGFRADYDMTAAGTLNKTSQIRLIGNSVCPPVGAAVVRANLTAPSSRRIAA